MAIKVKHEGNVTSRAYASAAGGKGKRQAEDARVLASMQRGGMGGGGGGTGGGARAGGSAPTLSAPTSHATLGSVGSLITPTKSFGQEKELQKQRDDAALTRQKDEQTWKSGENEKAIAAQAEQERLRREARQKDLEDERKWRENQQLEKERREMRRDTLRWKGYSEESILKIEENTRKKESIEGDANLTPEQKATALEEVDKERDGIKPSYEPMPDPNDPAESIREVKLSDGRKIQMIRDARGNWTEYVPDRSKMSPQEIWDSAFVAPDGTRWISDGRGGITPLTDPNAKAGAIEKNERTKWILERVKELLNPDINGNDSKFTPETAAKRAAEEYDAASGGGATPTSTSKPIGTDKEGNPIYSLPADEEKKNKWGSFAR